MKKEVFITVKDLIEYLSEFPTDTQVFLDKNNWETKEGQSPKEIIKYNGIFTYSSLCSCLIIRN